MMGNSNLTGGDSKLEEVGLDRQMGASRKVLKAALTFLEIVVLGAAACGPTTAPQNPEQTPPPPGKTLVETNLPNHPLDAPVRIQPIETVGSFEPAINPPEYSVSGGPIEGLTADQQDALLAKAVFPVFRQKLIDSGQLQVGDPYFFEGADQQAAQLTFEAEMKTFLESHPELSVRMNQQVGEVLAFVEEKMPDGSTAIKFAFKQNGVLAYAEPNWFYVDTVAGNVPVRKGYRAEFIYNPVDKHWYLFEVDEKTGKANAWFKTNGATVDNLERQWEKYVAPVVISPDRLVQTDRGLVYVNDEGRLILISPKDGSESKAAFEQLNFGDITGASKIVKAMYPKEFEGDQQALRDFLFPPGLALPRDLQYAAEGTIVTGTTDIKGTRSIYVYGKVLKPTLVAGQIIVFYAVPDCHDPVSQVISKQWRSGGPWSGSNPNWLHLTASPSEPNELGSDDYRTKRMNSGPKSRLQSGAQMDVQMIDSQLRGRRVLTSFIMAITAPKGGHQYKALEEQYGNALYGDDYAGENPLLIQAMNDVGRDATPGEVLQRAIELAANRPERAIFIPDEVVLYVFYQTE